MNKQRMKAHPGALVLLLVASVFLIPSLSRPGLGLLVVALVVYGLVLQIHRSES